MNKQLEIISLIYKSVDYLNLIYTELKSDKCKVEGWDINIRLVLNDATKEILDAVKTLDIPYTIYNDPIPDDYYLNRVYRCWNYAGKTSEYDNICFVNSDMVFGQNWLHNLLKHHDGNNIPTSRLIESGKIPSGQYAIPANAGRHPREINYQGFYSAVDRLSEDKVCPGGLFMPCVFEKKRFLESGMYPEGNVYTTGVGKYGDPFIESGDKHYFDKLERQYGMKHVTVFDSLVYHIQEGEKDS